MKLIRKDRTHNGLVFKEGLNCLLETETFDKRPECGTGGLYFCKEEDIEHWLSLYNSDIGFYRNGNIVSRFHMRVNGIKSQTEGGPIYSRAFSAD